MDIKGGLYKRFTQGVSVLLCAVLILLSPGLAPYQALAAQQDFQGGAQNPGDPSSVGPLSISNPDSLAPLGDGAAAFSGGSGNANVDGRITDQELLSEKIPAAEAAEKVDAAGNSANAKIAFAADAPIVSNAGSVSSESPQSFLTRIKASFKSAIKSGLSFSSGGSVETATRKVGENFDQSRDAGRASDQIPSKKQSSVLKTVKKSAWGIGLSAALPALAFAKAVPVPIHAHAAAKTAALASNAAAISGTHIFSAVAPIVPFLEKYGNLLGHGPARDLFRADKRV
jgi:hypothetical protein